MKAAIFWVEVGGRGCWYSFRRFALEPCLEAGKSIPGPRIRDGSAVWVGAASDSVTVLRSRVTSEDRRGVSGSGWSSLRGRVSS